MSLLSIENLGKLGMVADVLPHDLPPEAWTNVRNVRFRDNQVEKMHGASKAFVPVPAAAGPYWLLSVPGPTVYYWIVAGAAKVYATDGSSYSNITRQSAGVDVDYAMDNDTLWNGGLLGDVPVINNGVDVPQFWLPQSAGTRLADLTAWPTDMRAQVVRPFKQYLFALNVTKAGVPFHHMVKWSHSADPGTVPTSWDETDPALDAGETDLTDVASGPVIDCLPLRDALMIYKENSLYGALYVGGQFVFRFYKIFEQLGAMSIDCMALLGDGDQHIVMTGEDIIAHNGQAAQSLLTRRMRRWLVNRLNTDRFHRSFMVRNVHDRENWFCFPTTGSDWADLALVYEWDTGNLTVRELEDNASYMSTGRIIKPGIGAWDDDTQVWDADPEVWDVILHPSYQQRLLQASPETNKLFFVEDGNDFANTEMSSFAERTGLAIYGKAQDGTLKADITRMKLLKGIRPKITGGPISVQVGMQQNIGDPVVWEPAQTFTLGDYKLDFTTAGRLVAVRFESIDSQPWSLNGYDLDIELLGEF